MPLRTPLLMTLFALGCAHAPSPAATVAARPDDVGTIDGLMTAFYDVGKVQPGTAEQWERDRALYVPWIRFVSIVEDPGGPQVTAWTHPELVTATSPMVKSGFEERELRRRVYRSGNLAHVESSYEIRVGTDSHLSRGVSFLELFFDGTRWWIASVVWQEEDLVHPISPELLP